jgi:hypothetical protein
MNRVARKSEVYHSLWGLKKKKLIMPQKRNSTWFTKCWPHFSLLWNEERLAAEMQTNGHPLSTSRTHQVDISMPSYCHMNCNVSIFVIFSTNWASRVQRMAPAFIDHQFIMLSLLHCHSILHNCNPSCIPDCWWLMGNHNCWTTIMQSRTSSMTCMLWLGIQTACGLI